MSKISQTKKTRKSGNVKLGSNQKIILQKLFVLNSKQNFDTIIRKTLGKRVGLTNIDSIKRSLKKLVDRGLVKRFVKFSKIEFAITPKGKETIMRYM